MTQRTWLALTIVAAIGLSAPGCWMADVLKPPPEVTQEYDAAKELFQQQQYARSQVAFKAFLQNHADNPLAPWARYFLAQSYRQQELHEEAIDMFEQFFASSPSPQIEPIARYDLAECYRLTGNLKKATDEYAKVAQTGKALGSDSGQMFAELAQARLSELKAAAGQMPGK